MARGEELAARFLLSYCADSGAAAQVSDGRAAGATELWCAGAGLYRRRTAQIPGATPRFGSFREAVEIVRAAGRARVRFDRLFGDLTAAGALRFSEGRALQDKG
eukprot:CAMPEP_0115878660 /NCGR_PEP_ID=MMETSP0287-20121206/26893_1 /TAXON_ID=412157 /ORGANISM="Chrysochromulina rotalis, Strain UIO044" /LENGTH=103 /DNA_ID=CAMNT_0003334293 /DNA_START=86 /DNA_END=397 /DNA_ORIENTATION=-